MKGKASINRIRLEFKGNDAVRRLSRRYSINRIRLEFKADPNCIIVNIRACINRIRLEFKVKYRIVTCGVSVVIIESDWNLK